MPLPWFRMYTKFANDADIQMMPEHMQRRLLMIFCLRGEGQLNGPEEIAFRLRITEQELAETKRLFIEKGYIDESWTVLKWEKLQFSSDLSRERVRKYRDKREAAGLSRGSSFSDPSLYERDGRRCIYCLSPSQLCIDHIYPLFLGGDDHYDNLGVACKKCNSGKAGRTPEMAKYKILNDGARLRYERYVTTRGLPVTVTVTAENRTEQIQNRTKEPTPKAVAFVVPEWVSAESWAGFVEMRKKIRAPLTDRAARGIIRELESLRLKGHDPGAVLDQSTERCWRGIFELRSNGNGHRETISEKRGREALERLAAEDAAEAGERPSGTSTSVPGLLH